MHELLPPTQSMRYRFPFCVLTDDDWTVSRMENEDFELNTWLPGIYDVSCYTFIALLVACFPSTVSDSSQTIVTDTDSAAFNESKCSTKHLHCSYTFGEILKLARDLCLAFCIYFCKRVMLCLFRFKEPHEDKVVGHNVSRSDVGYL